MRFSKKQDQHRYIRFTPALGKSLLTDTGYYYNPYLKCVDAKTALFDWISTGGIIMRDDIPPGEEGRIQSDIEFRYRLEKFYNPYRQC